ncbi:hypothetical protein B0H10DRAFT_598096 [Mycena sp. CBHHK59/15]|nr:hypothetical protein B0H10DRAFT_598096 [Mycena sp. CBHHK59/15]
MLIVTNPGPQGGSGPFIDLDSITVYSASSMDGIGNVNGQAQSSPVANQTGFVVSALSYVRFSSYFPTHRSGHESSGLSKGAMIGIIAGSVLAVVAVLALIAGLLLFLRRRKRRQHPIDPKTPVDAELPLQGPNMMQFTPVSPSRPVPTFSRMSSHSIAPSYYYGTDNSSLASLASTTPMVPKVPTLSMPKMPSRSQQGVMIPSRGPGRPSRPPSLELPP